MDLISRFDPAKAQKGHGVTLLASVVHAKSSVPRSITRGDEPYIFSIT